MFGKIVAGKGLKFATSVYTEVKMILSAKMILSIV